VEDGADRRAPLVSERTKKEKRKRRGREVGPRPGWWAGRRKAGGVRLGRASCWATAGKGEREREEWVGGFVFFSNFSN
jgi:hypothetical protein